MMETPGHDLTALFEQLGLDNTDQGIESFVTAHKPIPHDRLLHEADFWSPAQSAFLKEAVEEDADWAIVVDTLNTLLR